MTCSIFFYLVVNVERVVDSDLKTGAVEDVKGLGEERKLVARSCGQKDATATSLSNTVMTSLRGNLKRKC